MQRSYIYKCKHGAVFDLLLFMDEDLHHMNKDQLIAEVIRLRQGIREHRDSTGQELCWHHPDLWSLLPEKINPEISVPPWPEFLKGCIQYRKSLDSVDKQG